MYEELTKRLQDFAAETRRDDDAEIAFDALEAIEKLEHKVFILEGDREGLIAQIPRWIPVEERKPKTDDIVIVAIHDDSGDTPYDVTSVGFYLDVFPLGIWVVENERCNYVTHWMSLPDPQVEE